jgi:beta-N-acetylhexosaminidase
MVGISPERLGKGDATTLVDTHGVGGVWVKGTAEEIRAAGLSDLRTSLDLPLLVATDQEGGEVVRVKGGPPLSAARQLATRVAPGEVAALAQAEGERLRAVGVNTDLAPVVDVAAADFRAAALGSRSFSDDPALVTEYAGTFAGGLRAAGVLPVFKHFPGHGRADGDSHEHAVGTPPLAELERVDLVPYRSLLRAGESGVLVGHLDVPGLTTPGVPASLDAAAIRYLREVLGFDGLVVTDELQEMEAIASEHGLLEAVRLSLIAGNDVALWFAAPAGSRTGEVLDHLEAAVRDGTLPETQVDASVGRVLAAKRFTSGATC